MPFTTCLRRLPVVAAFLSVIPAACSIEQTKNRCAEESSGPDALIACVQKAHARAGRCETHQRGATAMPVAGRQVIKFGEVTKHGGTSKGIVFEGAAQAEIRAPVTGLVTFADKWRSYGDLLIIDACSTVALMAGTFSPDVMESQTVNAGDVVARMGQASPDAPVIYLELRENSAAVDPAAIIPTN